MKSVLLLFIGVFISSFLFAQNECDPNNTFSEACPITITNLMGEVNGSINPSYDVDYFSFSIPRSGVITYTVSNVPANIIVEAHLFHDSNQNSALSNAYSGGGGQSISNTQLVCPSGKYYISVKSAGSQQNTGLYNLKISLDTSDVHECNNSFTDCTPMVLNQNVQGAINTSYDNDYYCFSIPRSGIITYTVSGVPANIIMEAHLFHESNQNSAISNAYSGGGGQSITGSQLVCPSGQYYIQLKSAGSQQNAGLYTLKVTLDTSDVYECNNSFTECTAMTLNQNIKGAINTSYDNDYYCFSTPRTGVLTCSVTGVPANIIMEAHVFPSSNQNSAVLNVYSGGGGQSISGSQLVCESGLYYVQLKSAGSQQNAGLYTLKMTLDTTDVYECNNSFTECTSLSLNQNFQGAINTAYDIDYYCFTIPRSGVIAYTVSGVPANIIMEAHLFHESNQNSAVSNTYSGGGGQSISGSQLVCPSGQYYLQLKSAGSQQNAGLYTLKVTLDTSDVYECNNDFLTASMVSCNTPVFASINSANDVDCYKITLTQPDIITVNVTNVPANLDVTVTLVGPAPSTTELKKVNGTTGASVTLVSPTALQPGTYFVCITDNKANTAQYQLNINCPSVVGTEENQLSESVVVYPNPTNDFLYLDIKGNFNPNEYKVRSLLGELILYGQIASKNQTIDVSNLSAGLYIIEVKGAEGRTSSQFIKI